MAKCLFPLCVLGAFALLQAVSGIGLEIQTEYGRIRGVQIQDPPVIAFYAIPYAAPPVDSRRWKPPTAPTPWKTTRDCSKKEYFQACPQFHAWNATVFGKEDCLYMNIYVPTNTSFQTPLPVMFWIYGGGYTIGDDNEFGLYDARKIAAARGVIVVEHNYRLGALGLLAMDELQHEDPNGTTGNYALQDQQFAMAFAYRNIARFGGDASRIAIFGESAGAFSVCWHYVSPISQQYFHAAIMESGTCSSSLFFPTLTRAKTFSDIVVKWVGCENATDVLACLRARPMGDFFLPPKAWPPGLSPPLAPGMPYGPAIDGTRGGLLARPMDLINQGRGARVPLLIGTNHDEGTLFIPDAPSLVPGVHYPLRPEDIAPMLQHFFNDTTTQDIQAFYPLSSFKDPDAMMAVVLRDFFFLCPSREAATVLSSQSVPVFMYQFTQQMKNWLVYNLLGDFHAIELQYVFDHAIPTHTFTPDDQALAALMPRYWASMAAAGHPNSELGGNLFWPPYNATSTQYMDLHIPNNVGSGLGDRECAFWATHYTKYDFDT